VDVPPTATAPVKFSFTWGFARHGCLHAETHVAAVVRVAAKWLAGKGRGGLGFGGEVGICGGRWRRLVRGQEARVFPAALRSTPYLLATGPSPPGLNAWWELPRGLWLFVGGQRPVSL